MSCAAGTWASDRQRAQHGAAPRLRYAILELSLRCNLRCAHCAAGAGRPRVAELDRAAWERVVADLAQLECPAVDLMGGEVLLSPLLAPVGRALAARGIAWGVLTNGWLLDEQRAAELWRAGCRGVGVSLDGATAATHDAIRGRAGAFDRALRALAALAPLDLKPRNRSVLTTVSTRNVDQLEALGELLSLRFPGYRWQLNLCSAPAPRLDAALRLDAAGIERVARFIHQARSEQRYAVHVSAAHDLGYFVDEELDLRDADAPWTGCPAGIEHLGVQSDGLVKGCLALDASFGVGRVTETPLRELWRDPARMARYRELDAQQLGPACRGCVWGTRCRGGCTAYATARSGRPHEHPDCLWRRASERTRQRAVQRLDAGPGRARPGAEPGEWPLPLRSACIELTLRCNLRCVHCGSAAGTARAAELELASFVELFRDMYLLGGQRVVLLGGEPLLHPDWDSIAMIASGFDLEVALISNGLPVTDDTARRMAQLGLSHVGISIDGATDATHDRIRGAPGARRRAWLAVQRLQQVGLPVTVITTLNRLNAGELAALRDQLAARPGLVWQLQAANGTGARFAHELMLGPAELLAVARFIAETRRALPRDQLAVAAGHNIGHHACTVSDYGAAGSWQGCPGGITAVGICSDGSVKGCLSMSACEVVGNIHHTRLAEIWRDRTRFARIRDYTPGRLAGGCGRCPHGSTCRGGCPEMARTATGDVWDNPLCLRQAEA